MARLNPRNSATRRAIKGLALCAALFLLVMSGLHSSADVFASPGGLRAANLLATATAPVLNGATSFAVLAGQTVTNTGPSSVTGDLGVSPGSAVTGFPPGSVAGTIYSGTPDAVALNAQNANTAAYNVLAGEPCGTNETGHDLGTLPTLTPGVYCFTSAAQLTGTLTLDDSSGGVFVF